MSLYKNAFTVSMLTFISRIFGYVRDILFAAILGASALNDIFIIAFRLPNLFRTIFAEGAFNASFIPIFSRLTHKNDISRAKQFAQSIQTLLLLILIIFCLVMIYMMPQFMALTAPGYVGKEEFELLVFLGRVTFPYILFMSMMAFYGGILNSFDRYFAFASAPVILNIVFIMATPFVYITENPAEIFAYAAIIAGALEMLWVMFFAYKIGFLVKIAKPVFTPEVKKMFYKIGPGILGSGVAQINVWVSTIIASFIIGGNSFLYYADRIYQLPLALIGTAMGTVLLPVLSKSFAKNDKSDALAIQNKAIDFCMLIIIPAFMGMAVLSYNIIHVLFEHGNFTNEATIKTANALFVFSFGLPAYVLVKILSSNFFANDDTKTPVKIAAVSVAINILISWMFLELFEHVAIAIGSVCAAWFNSIALLVIAKKRNNYIANNDLVIRMFKMVISGLLMVIAMIVVKNLIDEMNQIISLFILIFVGALIYFISAMLFKLITRNELQKYLVFKR